MPNKQHLSLSQLAACLRALRQAYRYANLASHHLLGALLKLLLAAYFIFALLVLFLRYVVLPNIDFYKKDIEHFASRALGNQVSIARVYASWQGLRPSLFFGDVVVRGADGRAALSLPSVAATFSWWSVIAMDVRFERLEISRPDLDIMRDKSGKFYVAGIFVDPDKGGNGTGLDWLLAQRAVAIHEGVVHWTDQLRGAPRLTLTDVNLLMRNQWLQHQLALQATPPAAIGSPLDIRFDFAHPAFSRHISDVSQWKGELYAAVQDTDLAAWLPYVNYPIAVQQGHGSVRAWLTLDHAKLDNVTADLRLSNAVARLGPQLPLLNLKRVSGRISARETVEAGAFEGKPAFGALGHAIEVSDFSLETSDGLTLQPTSIAESYTPARQGQPEKTTIAAKLLDLHTLFELAARLPMAPASRQLLTDFAPRGQVSDFSAQWQGAYPAIAAYNARGNFKDLSLQPQPARPARPKTALQAAQAAVPAIPGFSHLTGSFDASDKGGSFKLDSDGLTLQFPGYFADPVMPFERLNMQASWHFQGSDQLMLDIASMNFVQAGMSGSLSGKHLMPLNPQAGQSLGHVDFTGHIDSFDVTTIKRYLPLQTPRSLAGWLGGALEAGHARDVSVRLRGDLADFPFAAKKKAGEKGGDGEFRVFGKLDNVTLNYSPGDLAKDGKAPLWPQAKNIKGTILFDRTRMEINGDTATTAGVALASVKAVIPDLLAKDMQLEIVGAASGALPDFIRYVNVSPVDDWIANFTQETRSSGAAKLALKLQLPLDHLKDAKVQGTLQFLNDEIVLQTDIPPMSSTVGKLNFSERGFDLAGVNASLLGGPVTLAGGTMRDGSTLVRAVGSISSDGVHKNYPDPQLSRLIGHVNGTARYQLLVTVKGDQPELQLESTLMGMASTLPEPFKKSAGTAMPFRLTMNALASSEPGVLRDEIRATLGGGSTIHYVRQKSRDKNASWRVVRGGTVLNLNVKSIDTDAWHSVIDAICSVPEPVPARAAGRAGDPHAGSGAGAIDALAQYLDIDVLAAKSREMISMGQKLENVVIAASHLKNVWQATIDSNQVNGYLIWREASALPGQGQDKATVRLNSLVISPSVASDVSDLLEGKNTSKQIPALDVTVDNFEMLGKKLGRLELVANNIQTGAVREWRINKLSLVNPDAQLNMTGKWISGNGAGSGTSLHYDLDLKDAGKLLDRVGFVHVMRAGSGKMDGDLAWAGGPFSLDVPSLSGKINLNLGTGQFLKVQPGAAKLLGVLNLQALPHLLKLDFRDIFSEGLAFDGITASAAINQGVIKTDNLKMRSVAATVLMDGSADVAKESQNLRVVVIPEFNLGTGSLVYMLAVNPAVGLGTFLAQLFIRQPVMKAMTYQYQITGPWKEPVVTKLGAEFTAVPALDLPGQDNKPLSDADKAGVKP